METHVIQLGLDEKRIVKAAILVLAGGIRLWARMQTDYPSIDKVIEQAGITNKQISDTLNGVF